jgi:DNA-binding GntR family transcriptional regulator
MYTPPSKRDGATPPRQPGKQLAYAHMKSVVLPDVGPEGGFVTEGEVAAALGISRTPVREAFLRLEAEGLLRLLPGKGAFVSGVSNVEIVEVMQARELIESFAVPGAIAARTELAPRLREVLGEQKAVLKKGDAKAFPEHDRRFHFLFVEAGGNRLLARFYETLRDRQLRMGPYVHGVQAVMSSDRRLEGVLRQHGAIVAALEAGDEARLRGAIRAHLATTGAGLQPGSPA